MTTTTALAGWAPSAGWAAEPYLGASQGLHGEVSLLPFEAELLEDTPERVSLKTWTRCYRSPLNLERVLSLERDKACLFIHERLENESGKTTPSWGHHRFGEPFLDESCGRRSGRRSMCYTTATVVGNCDGYEFAYGPAPKLEDIRGAGKEAHPPMALFKTSRRLVRPHNPRLGVGFGMAWDAELFKYLWMWQVYGGHNDYPWYGRTYNCALEPFTSYPPAGVAKAIENGSARVMKPGEIIQTDLLAVAYEGEGGPGSIAAGSEVVDCDAGPPWRPRRDGRTCSKSR
jgi:hypothetical protein